MKFAPPGDEQRRAVPQAPAVAGNANEVLGIDTANTADGARLDAPATDDQKAFA